MSSRYAVVAIELLLTMVLLAGAIFRPRTGASWFRAIELRLLRMSGQHIICAVALFTLVIGARLMLLPIIPEPSPNIHDEFSYLLAADTFSSGRLTNTPNRFWESFETVHVLQQPSYASMYPPLQGLFLALGQTVFGNPWFGVCISVGVMVVAIYWMLLGWVAPMPALAGSILVAVRWGIFSYWMNSYWGGAPSAFGGALILGSLPRLLRAARLREALALAFGLCLLANSRPYEGLLLSLTALAYLFGWQWRRSASQLSRMGPKALLVPLLLISLCASLTFLYNRRVTGQGLLLPYVLDRSQYASAPLLLFLPLRPEPVFRDDALRRVYAEEVGLYRRARYEWGLPEAGRKLKDLWLFFVGPLFSLPLVAVFFSRFNRGDDREFFFSVLLAIILAGLLLEVWFYPHYAAPATGALAAILVLGLQRMRSWTWWGRPSGLFLARSLPLACVFLAVLPIGAGVIGFPLADWPLQWYGGTRAKLHTADAFTRLGSGGEQDLVFVRYSGASRATDGEWIFNRADIEHAPVIWARDKGPARNIQLVKYFAGRRVWIFEPDMRPWRLVPYEPSRTGADGTSDSVR